MNFEQLEHFTWIVNASLLAILWLGNGVIGYIVSVRSKTEEMVERYKRAFMASFVVAALLPLGGSLYFIGGTLVAGQGIHDGLLWTLAILGPLSTLILFGLSAPATYVGAMLAETTPSVKKKKRKRRRNTESH